MDKDSIILKHEQFEADKLTENVAELSQSGEMQTAQLDEMQTRIDAMYKKLGKTKAVVVPDIKEESDSIEPLSTPVGSYDELYEVACKSLKERGLDVDSIDFNELIEDDELQKILEELDAPLPRDQKWKKSDFIVVFIAALVGCAVDFAIGNRDNKMTGKGSKFSNWLNEIHEKKFKHASGASIDFQGKIDGFSFGGGNHRELSKGHDLLRFVEGINSFKTGTFEAVAYENGVKHIIKSTVNQYGNPYQEITLIAAILEYAHHMIADLFSNNSLPFPGYSFLQESSNRDLRKFAADMYANGFNLKNVMIQSVTAVIIEILIRLYFSIQSVKEYKDSVDVADDYSNWEAIKAFVKPTSKDKLHEMLLVAHSIVLAFNVGKIVITKNVADINVAEIISVVKYGIKVTKAVAYRNSDYAKVVYHSNEINKQWGEIANDLDVYDEELLAEMTESLNIA